MLRTVLESVPILTDNVEFELLEYPLSCCMRFRRPQNDAAFKAFYAEKNAHSYVLSLVVLAGFAVLSWVLAISGAAEESVSVGSKKGQGHQLAAGDLTQLTRALLLWLGVVPATVLLKTMDALQSRCPGAWDWFKAHFDILSLTVSFAVSMCILMGETRPGSPNYLGVYKVGVIEPLSPPLPLFSFMTYSPPLFF